MRLIERYLFRQLLGPAIAATLALGAVAILSQTLSTLDVLVDQHQAAGTFLKIIALSLPQMLSIVLPIALFVAALITLNRLHTEQEIVVCFAGGMSRWRVISPFIRLAVMAALITLVVNLWISPWSQRARQDEIFKIRTDLIASLVRDGAFTQPGKGLTVYAQSTDRDGLLHNVFIDQDKAGGGSTTFSAQRGQIVMRDGKPGFVLRTGSNQSFSKDGSLNYLSFDEYLFDLSPYVNTTEVVYYKAIDRYFHELVAPDLKNPDDRRNRKRLLAEAHARLAAPFYDIAAVSLALAGVIGGAFSRTGYGRRILLVCAAAALMRILGFAAQAACDASIAMNVIQYAVPLIPTWFALREVFRQNAHGSSAMGPAVTPLTPLGAAA
jgi:lipopolysaccharide export system permease protein